MKMIVDLVYNKPVFLFIRIKLTSVIACAGDEFQCDNGLCISMKLKCNDARDCADRSDEQNCRM